MLWGVASVSVFSPTHLTSYCLAVSASCPTQHQHHILSNVLLFTLQASIYHPSLQQEYRSTVLRWTEGEYEPCLLSPNRFLNAWSHPRISMTMLYCRGFCSCSCFVTAGIRCEKRRASQSPLSLLPAPLLHSFIHLFCIRPSLLMFSVKLTYWHLHLLLSHTLLVLYHAINWCCIREVCAANCVSPHH